MWAGWPQKILIKSEIIASYESRAPPRQPGAAAGPSPGWRLPGSLAPGFLLFFRAAVLPATGRSQRRAAGGPRRGQELHGTFGAGSLRLWDHRHRRLRSALGPHPSLGAPPALRPSPHAAPAAGRACPAIRESARSFPVAAAPSALLPGGAAAQRRPGCGKQQQQLAAAASPAGSPLQPGARAEHCLAPQTAHLYPAPGHPPLPSAGPPGKIRTRSCALQGLEVSASQAAASTGGISASWPPPPPASGAAPPGRAQGANGGCPPLARGLRSAGGHRRTLFAPGRCSERGWAGLGCALWLPCLWALNIHAFDFLLAAAGQRRGWSAAAAVPDPAVRLEGPPGWGPSVRSPPPRAGSSPGRSRGPVFLTAAVGAGGRSLSGRIGTSLLTPIGIDRLRRHGAGQPPGPAAWRPGASFPCQPCRAGTGLARSSAEACAWGRLPGGCRRLDSPWGPRETRPAASTPEPRGTG
ncbi:uncharacterized protein J5M81_015045 [Pluvialis apricaria]